MRWYQRLSTRLAITVIIFIGILIIGFTLLATSLTYSRLKQDVEDDRQAKVKIFRQDLESINSLTQEQVKTAMRVLKSEGQGFGAASLGESVQVGERVVPNLILGANGQANNYAIVDKVKNLVGGTATLFVKSDNDFVRVSTNVQKDNGSRAVGTVLDPQGKAIVEIRQGKPFYGAVYILNKPYLTGYEPIKSNSGEIIGIWYVGYPLSSLDQLKSKIETATILQTGFLTLVDDKGKALYKPSNVTDEILEKAIQAKPDEMSGWNLQHTNFEAWGYKIVSAYSSNDPELINQLIKARFWDITGNIALLILLGVLITFLVRRSLRPLETAVKVAKELSQGKISNEEFQIKTKDEIAEMLYAMHEVNDYIRDVAEAANSLGKGDLSGKITPRSSYDLLSSNINKVIQTLHDLTDETQELIKSVEEGNLGIRGNTEKFSGSYARLVKEINVMMDKIVTPINEASSVLEKVAACNLATKMTGDYKGDFAKIKTSINAAIENLNQSLQHIASGAEQVASASNQISDGSQALAQGASEQASTLEEVFGTIQEISSVIAKNASNAQEARSLSDKAKISTNKGVANMNRLNEAITLLKDSSDSTAKIVKTIEEIAFQTNLLALNAAVEAARAGEAGKGFAVVADEVRNLAMRSAEAAKQTAELIEQSVRNTENGVNLNTAVLDSLEEISREVQDVNTVIAEIAVACEEQKHEVEQINSAVEQISQVTQASAANAEESASASEELSGQSQEMLSLIGNFKLSLSERETMRLTSHGQKTNASFSAL